MPAELKTTSFGSNRGRDGSFFCGSGTDSWSFAQPWLGVLNEWMVFI
ncbi:unnamed protein product [Acidithrix sp. C25]|nr:unnamed protein product [Acidithrix sp. C25]